MGRSTLQWVNPQDASFQTLSIKVQGWLKVNGVTVGTFILVYKQISTLKIYIRYKKNGEQYFFVGSEYLIRNKTHIAKK